VLGRHPTSPRGLLSDLESGRYWLARAVAYAVALFSAPMLGHRRTSAGSVSQVALRRDDVSRPSGGRNETLVSVCPLDLVSDTHAALDDLQYFALAGR
jgi:hypothetical protein